MAQPEPVRREILCVEDHKPLAKLITLALQRSGYRVHLVHSGEQVVGKAEELRPSLILLDVMMPGMDGFQILRALQAHPLMQAIPVIMCTARSTEKDRQDALVAGAADFITKPFSIEHLTCKVNAVFERLERIREGLPVE
jgi:DNA-binding response OmpR family regulator